jgi:KDO2-lipid IV(A) lauroyltransferase
LSRGRGYEIEFRPPLKDFPSGDAVADTTRMNREIEAAVREMPEQYFWLHKRFKTRPPGEPKLY